MRARPELVGGVDGAVDTDLMRLRDGWIAKGGAEGLFCAAHDGRPSASRSRPRTERTRALGPALAQLLGDRRVPRGAVAQQPRRDVVGVD